MTAVYKIRKLPVHMDKFELIIKSYWGDADGYDKTIILCDKNEFEKSLDIIQQMITLDNSEQYETIVDFDHWAERHDFPADWENHGYYTFDSLKCFWYDDIGIRYEVDVTL